MKIATNFYVQFPKAEKSNIFISVSWEGNRLQKSIGISIKPKHWDKKRSKIKSAALNSLEINLYLENIRREISDYYFRLKTDNMYISREMIRNKIGDLLNPLEKIKEEEVFRLNMIDTFCKFIDERKESDKFKYTTIQRYQVTLNHMIAYSKKRRLELEFSMMNQKFSDSFMKYLLDKPIVSVTAIKILKNLMVFLNDCFKKGLIDNTNYKEEFNATIKDIGGGREAQTIALEEDELELIENFVPKTPRLGKVRDLFLIQCYTGLRVSDLMKLGPHNFELNAREITVMTTKTDESIIIPIHKQLMKIVMRYPNLNFPKLSDQKYREYIKEMCKLIGLDRPYQRTKFYGKKRVDEIVPLYQLVSSHTGRRTFITLSLKKGLLPEEVMKITGHKSRASFQKYVRVAQKRAVDSVRSAWGG